jgi:hypothetical protein
MQVRCPGYLPRNGRTSVASGLLPDDPAVAAAVLSGPPQPYDDFGACGRARLQSHPNHTRTETATDLRPPSER